MKTLREVTVQPGLFDTYEIRLDVSFPSTNLPARTTVMSLSRDEAFSLLRMLNEVLEQ